MNMNDLEMCKAIAKLEGIKVVEEDGALWTLSTLDKYNPIADLALNCALRDKYEVDIVYSLNYTTSDKPKTASGFVEYADIEDVPMAVVKCILKANGLYIEDCKDE